MARKKAATGSQADEILRQMFPTLPTSDDFAQEEGKKPGAEDLQAKIANLEGQLAALSARPSAAAPVQRAKSALPAMPVAPDVDKLMEEAPDPTADPKAYAKYMAGVVQAQANYEKQKYQWEQQVVAQQSSRTADLWSTFADTHKEYAKDEEKAQIAAERVVSRAKAQGLSLDSYMHETPDKFMADVTKEYDRLFGKPQAEGAEEDDDDLEDDDERTEILGGSASRGGPARKGTEAPARYGALGSELAAWQQKTGFYR